MRTGRTVQVFALAATLLVNGLSVAAQDNERKVVREKVVQQDVIVTTPHGGAAHSLPRMPGHGIGFGDGDFVFVSSEMAIDGKVVKGAPYSAQAVTETTHTLADGNRIVRRNTANLYRDSEGRTRREHTIGSIGPYAHAGEPLVTLFINDPVAGVNYVLDSRTKTARKLPALPQRFERRIAGPGASKGTGVGAGIGKGVNTSGGGGSAESKSAQTAAPRRARSSGYVFSAPAPGPVGGGTAPDVMFYSSEGEEPKTEQLGKQVVEGVEAEGLRVTMTIPAGAIGNERAIEVVTERWFSAELQTVVMTRHSDPRFGETIYRLTNINRTEPAHTLFEVPSDYTIKEAPKPNIQFYKRNSSESPAQPEN